MPMIEFRYIRENISDLKARELGLGFEESFRKAMRLIRSKDDYGLTVEGDPFHIHHNQPDLRLYVFYHQEWNLSDDELERLTVSMTANVEQQLKDAEVSYVTTKVRFYARTGYKGASIPLSQK